MKTQWFLQDDAKYILICAKLGNHQKLFFSSIYAKIPKQIFYMKHLKIMLLESRYMSFIRSLGQGLILKFDSSLATS